MKSAAAKGMEWEDRAEAAYTVLGFEFTRPERRRTYDFMVNGYRVDVKGCTPRMLSGGFRSYFCACNSRLLTNPEDLTGRCDFFHLMVFHDRLCDFIVPAADLHSANIQFQSDPIDRNWAKYYQAWQLLAEGPSAPTLTTSTWGGLQEWIEAGGVVDAVSMRHAQRQLGIRLGDLAAAAGYRADSLYRYSTGRSPITDVMQQRLTKAVCRLAIGGDAA